MKHRKRAGSVLISFREMLDFQRMPARGPRNIESNVRPLDIGFRQVRCLKAFDFLLSRLHLRRPGAGRKPRDEILQLLNLLLALSIFGFDS